MKARQPEQRNLPPRNEWDAMRRLLKCNKQQLAERLGISAVTLAKWEKRTAEGLKPRANTRRAVAELLRVTLRAANDADEYLIDRKL